MPFYLSPIFLPLKCEIMAEKQDIAMNQFPVVTDLSYVYGEKSNNQNKIAVEDLAKQMGIYTKKWDSNKGDLLEINAPYSIFIIGESVIGGHIMGVFANNITVLSKARQFSETKDQEGTINIYRKDEHSIIVQNNIEKMNIRILFLSSYYNSSLKIRHA